MKLDKQKTKEKEPDNRPIYDKVIKSGQFMKWISGKDAARVATALIYERIGTSEIFLGGYPLLKGKFDIGEYLVLEHGSKRYFMDTLGSEAYTMCKDKKLGKIVEVVKFGEDDYRVRAKADPSYYKSYKQPIMEEVELIEDGERIIDENGDVVKVRVHKTDEQGNKLYKEVKDYYKEPVGVTQEGRQAIRVHNSKKQEIKEFKDKNKGFFEKYGTVVLPIVGLALIAMLFLMGMKFQTDAWAAGVKELTGDIRETNDNLQWWQKPDALDKIGQAVAKTQDEKNSPPVK